MTDDTRLRWPTGTDYSRAVQSPQLAFKADELSATEPVISAMGVPMAATGQNAVVFLLRDLMQRSFALRCFTTPSPDGAQRYQALASHLSTLPTPTKLAAATWIEDGVLVGERHWPVVLMPWVSGKPMNLAVEDMLEDDPSALVKLADRWMAAVEQLQASSIAHGDLQHGNVLVAEDGEVTFVDLDGVWVPDSKLPPPNEVGHPNYQHPGREGRHWGRYVDSFSALLIDASLRAMAADPSLQDHMGGENLVISRPDLVNHKTSKAWTALAKSPDPEVQRKVEVLWRLLSAPFEETLRPVRELVSLSPADVAVNESVLSTPPPLPPLGAAPAPAAAGNWWEQGAASAGPDDRTVAKESVGAGASPRSKTPSTPQPQKDWAAPAAASTAATTTHVPQPAVVKRRVMIGKSPIVAGALAGLSAGIIGCVLYGAFKMGVDGFYRPALFMSIVASLIGGLVLAWQPFISGQVNVGFRRLGLGLLVGCGAGLVALLPADWVMQSLLDLPDQGRTEDPAVLPIGLVWAIVAALVGLAIGALQNARAAAFGYIGGAVAGFLGGLFYGATAAAFIGTRLLILQWERPTVFAVALVTTLIGLAIGAARTKAAVGTLTVIEGNLKGLEVLLKNKSSIGSSSIANTLAVSGNGVLSTHVELTIDDNGRCSANLLGPARINGQEFAHGAVALNSGDVLMVGNSYVRLKLRDRTEG